MKLRCGLAVLLLAFLAPALRAEEVLVSAAISLKDALTELAPLCLNTTGVTLTLNLDASGVLARQIQAGAPADVFISADDATMDTLGKAGVLEPHTRAPLLANALVVVVPADSKLKMDGPAALVGADVKRLGIGDPKTVPAGHYAELYFDKVKLADAVKDKLVPLGNVRAVLAAVAGSNVDAGVVYRTDAAIEPRVRVAYTVPAADGPAINYPIAVIKASHNPAAAEKVRTFLLSDQAAAVFKRFGFLIPQAAAAPAPAVAVPVK